MEVKEPQNVTNYTVAFKCPKEIICSHALILNRCTNSNYWTDCQRFDILSLNFYFQLAEADNDSGFNLTQMILKFD